VQVPASYHQLPKEKTNATFSDNYEKVKQLKDYDIFSINTITGKADKFKSKNEKQKYIEETRKLILSLDIEVKYRHDELISSHGTTIRKYRFLVDYMLNRIFYPQFLRDLHRLNKI
jgi:hypothetical protein